MTVDISANFHLRGHFVNLLTTEDTIDFRKGTINRLCSLVREEMSALCHSLRAHELVISRANKISNQFITFIFY